MKENTRKKTYTEEDTTKKDTHKDRKRSAFNGAQVKKKKRCPVKPVWGTEEKRDLADIQRKITI